MFRVTDQLGHTITLKNKPQKIVSLVPSQTELLYHLGLADEIAGVTKFCIHPVAEVQHKQKVGGTKQLNIELIKSLNPDLIIANKEENEQNQVVELMALYPTYVSNPVDLPGALNMINDIGQLVGADEAARQLSTAIQREFSRLEYLKTRSLKVAYLIWRQPYMAAGTDTFVNDMLQRCGWQNVIEKGRYPEVTMGQIAAAGPHVVLLSSEPYPFQQKHVDEFRQALPGVIIKLMDGEMFSWYGSRLLYAPEYFISLTDSIAAS